MNKFTKFLVLAFTLVLLVGAVVGMSVSASEGNDTEITYKENDDLITSFNVSYEGKLHLCFAINPFHPGQVSEGTGNFSIGKVQATINGVTYDLEVEEEQAPVYGAGHYSNVRTYAYVARTPGIAPKDLLTPITVYAEVSGTYENNNDNVLSFASCDTDTYSLAEYFFERLYKNGIINATSEADIARKELYLATLAYAEAAQDHFAHDAAERIENKIYVWGVKDLGLIEKGTQIELDNSGYALNYYDKTGAAGGNVTGAPGMYIFDKSTNIKYATENITAPEGAVTFESFEEGVKLPLNKALNEEGSALIAHASQTQSLYNFYVKNSYTTDGVAKTLYFDKFGKSYVAGESGMHWIVFQNNSGIEQTADTDLVFEARMRFSGNASIRFYEGRSAEKPESGSNIGEYKGTFKANGWYTLKIVVSGTTATFYIDGVEKGTATLKAVGVDVIQFTSSSSQFFEAEFEYVYFGGTEPEAVTATPATADRNCDYVTFAKNASNTDIAAEGSKVVNESAFKDGYTALLTETVDGVDNVYMQINKNSTGQNQPIYRIYNTTGAEATDTVVFEAKFRAQDVISLNSIDMTLRSGGTRVYRFYFDITTTKGLRNVGFNGQPSGNVGVDGVDFSEWVTIRIEYTATADEYNAEDLCARAWVNGVELDIAHNKAYTEKKGTVIVYGKASEIDNAAIILTSTNTGVLDIDDMYFGYKSAE